MSDRPPQRPLSELNWILAERFCAAEQLTPEQREAIDQERLLPIALTQEYYAKALTGAYVETKRQRATLKGFEMKRQRAALKMIQGDIE